MGGFSLGPDVMSVASRRGCGSVGAVAAAAGVAAGRGTLSGMGSMDASFSDAPQNRQNCAFLSEVPWQRLHVRVSAGAPETEAAFDTATTGDAATPGDGAGAATGIAGAGVAMGVGATGAASGLPHVMQNRMPGAFCAPQRGHFVCSAFGMIDAAGAETLLETLMGGCGTPIGGVGGAMRG